MDACPTDAISFIEAGDLDELSGKIEILHPEYNAQPSVYYISLPKKFIAGTVYDPVKEEIVEGAVCTITGGEKKFKVLTDGFGDFWFDGLDSGQYSLKIEHEHKVKQVNNIDTSKDVNLGDIAL